MVTTRREHVAEAPANQATRSGDGDRLGCRILLSFKTVEVDLEATVPEREESLELLFGTRPAKQTPSRAHGQLPIHMVLHHTSTPVLRLEAMRVDPSSEWSPDLLVTEEAILLEIGVENLKRDLGRATAHSKCDPPARRRGSFAALDRDLLPRRNESIEGTGAHMPREHVTDGMVQAGPENEVRHDPRQSAVACTSLSRGAGGKSVARWVRTRETKPWSLITTADAMSANLSSSSGVSRLMVITMTGRPL